MVIIDKNTLKQKAATFIQENHVTRLNKDPTDFNQKQIQPTIKKCDIMIDKRIKIPGKHKTNSTQTQCTYKNSQRD
jgi:hypothetical protein